MRTRTLAAGSLAALVALTGCGGEDAEDAAGTEEAAGSPEASPAETTAEPEVFRESIGLFQATDPATAELAELLDTGTVALDLTLMVQEESVEAVESDSGGVLLGFVFDEDDDGFLTLDVPAEALTSPDPEAQDFFSTLRGEFEVEAEPMPEVDYGLALTGSVPETETRDEQRCGDESTLVEDAEALAADPAVYEEVRERWSDSPRLWWAVKATAHSLAEYGDVSDSAATACAVYW
jgi:hypothetical protein